MSGKERAERLRKVAEILTARTQEISEIEARDGGGTIKKAMFADVPGAISSFNFFADCAENRPDVEERGESPFPPAKSIVRREPFGVTTRHRPVELPVHHGVVEDRAVDRGRQHERAQARELHVALRDRDGEGVPGGRHPARRRQPHHRSRWQCR